MAKKKEKKPAVKVDDLRATKDPKGGAYQTYFKIQGAKQGANKGTK